MNNMGENNNIKMYNGILMELADQDELELKDTIYLMIGDDYKERFIAEYTQLMIRYSKLSDLIVQYKKEKYIMASIDIEDLEEQVVIMKKYIDILQKRAKKECIELPKF